jgi:hypothetical protein
MPWLGKAVVGIAPVPNTVLQHGFALFSALVSVFQIYI